MNNRAIEELRVKAHQNLSKLSGVFAVDCGIRASNKEERSEVFWKVYVKDKNKAQAVLPAYYAGIPIEILTSHPGRLAACGDTVVHDPPLGGITIHNPQGGPLASGTLGCMATINGEAGRDRYALITNHHVLRGKNNLNNIPTHRPGGLSGDQVYSVAVTNTSGAEAVTMDGANSIATVNNIGKMELVEYPAGQPGAQQYFVDCASAKIDSCFSSWCDTNCGQGLDAQIRELGLASGNFIRGRRDLTATDVGTIVYKVGRTTGLTRGRITEPFKNGILVFEGFRIADNVIEVEFISSPCASTTVFMDQGDSGSVLITEDGYAVGLMFFFNHSVQRSYACHIGPVLQELNLEILTSNGSLGSPGTALRSAPGSLAVSNQNPHFKNLKRRFEEHPRGASLFRLIEEHRHEISELVNFCRPVTVVWHRSKGPAFLGHFINSSRNAHHDIPHEIEGVTLTNCIANMAQALFDHGSEPIKDLVLKHRDEVAQVSSKITKVEEFFTLLNSNPAS